MRRWAPRAITAIVLLVVALGCAAHEPAIPEWKLTESLRIGGAEVGPTSFEYIKGIEEDGEGRILVYDHGTQDIRFFAPDGKVLRVVGRTGSGPGEMRNAEGIVIAPDGRWWVRDAANARFNIFAPGGDFERSWTLHFCSSQGMWAPQVDPAGRIVDEDCIVEGDRAYRTAVLAYRTDMSGVDTLTMKPECGSEALALAGTWVTRTERSVRYQSIPYRSIQASALGPAGEVWCAPNAAHYEILKLGPVAGDTTRISRELPPVPVTVAERDSVIKEIEARGPTGLDFSRIPTSKPAIDRLTVDDAGRLWVQRTTAAGEKVFDIYDRQARLLATATLGRYAISQWRPFIVRGENVYTVVPGEDEIPYVVRFHVTR